jgi:hypothetical protein
MIHADAIVVSASIIGNDSPRPESTVLVVQYYRGNMPMEETMLKANAIFDRVIPGMTQEYIDRCHSVYWRTAILELRTE